MVMIAADTGRFTHLWQLFGYDVLDSHGARVGPVDRVWADNAAVTLKFIGLRTGRLLGQTYVIPAADAQIDDRARAIRVGYAAARIGGAPRHNTDVPLNSEQERKVFAHYDNL